MLRGILTSLLFVSAAVILSAGCDSVDSATGAEQDDDSPAPIKLTGTSGNDVSLNGTWTRPCASGDWGSNQSLHKLDGDKWTLQGTDYSGAACEAGTEAVESKATATVTDDALLVTISDWMDNSQNAAAPPAGLESVTQANGITWDITSATMEPLTAAAAAELNTMDAGAGYCGAADWAAGTAKDMMVCWFGSADPAPMKSSVVLDDTTAADVVSWYEAPDEFTVVDAAGYPTEIENYDPLTK